MAWTHTETTHDGLSRLLHITLRIQRLRLAQVSSDVERMLLAQTAHTGEHGVKLRETLRTLKDTMSQKVNAND